VVGVDPRPDETQIRQMIENLGHAFQSKDAEDFVRHFSEDVVALYPAVPLIRGVARWREFVEAAAKDNVSVEYEEIIVKASESGEYGYAVGIYGGVNKSSRGLEKFRSRFLVSLSKIGGEWRITAICYNRP
jgi:ketosteroid isomerase-like protein